MTRSTDCPPGYHPLPIPTARAVLEARCDCGLRVWECERQGARDGDCSDHDARVEAIEAERAAEYADETESDRLGLRSPWGAL